MNEQPQAGRPVVPERVVPAGRWTIFTAIWLLFLVFPIATDLLGRPHRPAELAALSAGMVAFVGLYLWLMLHEPFRDAPLSPWELRAHLALLGTLAGVVLALALADEATWLWFVLYANVAAAIKLPARSAAVTITTLTALTFGAAGLRLGWPSIDPTAAPCIGISVACIGSTYLVHTIRELRAAAEAVAAERLRFARDLHDLVGHSLSAIALKGEVARRFVRADPDRATREIDDALGVARAALVDVREAVGGYRQPTLATEIRAAREILAAAGIACRVAGSAPSLPPPTEAVLAWAVREGVTNVIRHSRARRCTIGATRRAGMVGVEIVDDGDGAAPTGDGGHGLRGLAERTACVGGRVEAGPGAAGGFRLGVALPLGGADGEG